MIEIGRRPCERGVANVTFTRRRYMQWPFASGRHAIMATGTGTGNRIVVEPHSGPVGCYVAIVACVRGRNMRRRLTCRRRIVVARKASGRSRRMIKSDIGPG